MLDILCSLAKSKEIACFYSNPQSDKFKCGYVLAVNEKEIVLHELSPNGGDDGIIVMATERIFRVERNTSYLKMLGKLCCDQTISEWLTSIDRENILLSVLSNPILKERIVSIELNDNGYYAASGFVEHVKNGQCIIKQIDDYGIEDGTTYVLTSDITELVISSDLENRIQKLWKINQNCDD